MGGQYYYHVRLLFEAILRKIESVDDKISALAQQVKAPPPLQTVYLSVSIQATYNALKTFNDPASAEQISVVTGRARAVESMYLNELFRMGLAEKEKRGRKRVFSLKEETS